MYKYSYVIYKAKDFMILFVCHKSKGKEVDIC